jgi:hypothetical protein
VNGEARILVQYSAVNIRLLHTIFQEGAGNIFLQPTDTSYLMDIFFIACPRSVGFRKLNKLKRND